MRHYVYRCTTDKLQEALDRITNSGDTIASVHHVGGRDWVIIATRDAALAQTGDGL